MNISKRKRIKTKRTPWIDSKYGRTHKMFSIASEMFGESQFIQSVYFGVKAV